MREEERGRERNEFREREKGAPWRAAAASLFFFSPSFLLFSFFLLLFFPYLKIEPGDIAGERSRSLAGCLPCGASCRYPLEEGLFLFWV